MNKSHLSFLILVTFYLASCSESPIEGVRSSEKQIISFKLQYVIPSLRFIDATVDEQNKKIKLVRDITDPEKATAVVTLSDNATIEPNPKYTQDYSKPVTFTITAEDGSSSTYVVDASLGLPKITSTNKTYFEPGDFIEISGEYFSASPLSNKIYLVENGNTMGIGSNFTSTYSQTRIVVEVPPQSALGTYQIKILVYDKYEFIYPVPIKIDYANKSTKLETVRTSFLTQNGNLVPYILTEGRFLGNTSSDQLLTAKLFFVSVFDESKRFPLTLVGWGYYGNTFTYFILNGSLPSSVTAGNYYVDVEFNGKVTRYDKQITFPW